MNRIDEIIIKERDNNITPTTELFVRLISKQVAKEIFEDIDDCFHTGDCGGEEFDSFDYDDVKKEWLGD